MSDGVERRRRARSRTESGRVWHFWVYQLDLNNASVISVHYLFSGSMVHRLNIRNVELLSITAAIHLPIGTQNIKASTVPCLSHAQEIQHSTR